MNISQIITLAVIIAALGGSMAYYMMQVPDKADSKGWDWLYGCGGCSALVNVTTGTGMTTAIAEC